MKWWVTLLILLLSGDFQMPIQIWVAGTTTNHAIITKAMTSAILKHSGVPTKKKVTSSIATQREKSATRRIVGSKTEFNSSFWNTNTTTVSIQAHQGLFNLNRPKIRYRNKDYERLKKQRNKQQQQRRRTGNKNTKVDLRRTTLRSTTANTFQYKRYMPNKWETPTVVFVKVWTKASTQNFNRQRSRRPGGPVFLTTTYYPQTAPARDKVNQWIPSQPFPMSTMNNLPLYEENYRDSKPLPGMPPRNNGQLKPPQKDGDEYEDSSFIIPTKQPGPGLKPNIKQPQGYEDDEYDDPITNFKQTTRVMNKKVSPAYLDQRPDQEYEDEYEDDSGKPSNKINIPLKTTLGGKTTLSKKTVKLTKEDDYDEEEDMPTTKPMKTTVKKSKVTAEEEYDEESEAGNEVKEETESADFKKKEEEIKKIVSTQYVPNVPVVTSKTVTFPKNLDKNAPDPDYKDKTIDLEAELLTTKKYTVKLVNIFDPNFGKES